MDIVPMPQNDVSNIDKFKIYFNKRAGWSNLHRSTMSLRGMERQSNLFEWIRNYGNFQFSIINFQIIFNFRIFKHY
jgi:hypothetical protein